MFKLGQPVRVNLAGMEVQGVLFHAALCGVYRDSVLREYRRNISRLRYRATSFW